MRESAVLNSICAQPFPVLPADIGTLLIGPGDDLAAMDISGATILTGVDQVIDGRHVRCDQLTDGQIGWKIVARCVSDIAAMAARPVACVVAAALPPDFGEERARSLFDAVRSAAEQLHCPLVGGDFALLARSTDPMVCSTTVLATTGHGPVVTRSGARPGDGVYVTGEFGRTLLDDGGGHHCSFQPRVNTALGLQRTLGERLHAMIDVSDGLGKDLYNIARMSRVAIEIDLDSIPGRNGATWREAVGDGEDYELAFAACGEVPRAIDGISISRIGEVRNESLSGSVTGQLGHQTWDLTTLGWEHESGSEDGHDSC